MKKAHRSAQIFTGVASLAVLGVIAAEFTHYDARGYSYYYVVGAAVAAIIAIAMFLNKSKTFYRLTLALATLVSAYSAYKIVEKLSIYATIGISWRAIINDVWDFMPCFFGSILFLGVAAIYATSTAAKKAFKSQKQSLFALVFSVLAALNTGGIWFAEKNDRKNFVCTTVRQSH